MGALRAAAAGAEGPGGDLVVVYTCMYIDMYIDMYIERGGWWCFILKIDGVGDYL